MQLSFKEAAFKQLLLFWAQVVDFDTGRVACVVFVVAALVNVERKLQWSLVVAAINLESFSVVIVTNS
ncbi:hypothetical protein D3C77_765150 [compost metagenome]